MVAEYGVRNEIEAMAKAYFADIHVECLLYGRSAVSERNSRKTQIIKISITYCFQLLPHITDRPEPFGVSNADIPCAANGSYIKYLGDGSINGGKTTGNLCTLQHCPANEPKFYFLSEIDNLI